MFVTVIILIVIVAVVLVLVVLAQNSKGGGLTSQFGGSGTSQLMGVKKTGDLMEQLTWGLISVLIVLTLSTNFILPKRSQDGGFSSPNIESAKDKAVIPGIDPVSSPAIQEETQDIGDELSAPSESE